MSILETLRDQEFQTTAAAWKAERRRQLEMLIQIHEVVLQAERRELAEFAALEGYDLAMAFASQTRAELAETVKCMGHDKRLTKYWYWDRWWSKIRNQETRKCA